jgi:hypothetical protein
VTHAQLTAASQPLTDPHPGCAGRLVAAGDQEGVLLCTGCLARFGVVGDLSMILFETPPLVTWIREGFGPRKGA